VAFNPWDTPEDKVLLRGVLSPGLARIENCARTFDYDHVRGYGTAGATAIYRGKPPLTFDIVLTLLTNQDWGEWVSWREIVLTPPAGPNAKAPSIQHPFLAQFGVGACVIESVSKPQDNGYGALEITIKCTEWTDRKRLALAKPIAATAEAPAKTPEEIYIEHLTGQVQELAKSKPANSG
jgi:hypothetical protein